MSFLYLTDLFRSHNIPRLLSSIATFSSQWPRTVYSIPFKFLTLYHLTSSLRPHFKLESRVFILDSEIFYRVSIDNGFPVCGGIILPDAIFFFMVWPICLCTKSWYSFNGCILQPCIWPASWYRVSNSFPQYGQLVLDEFLWPCSWFIWRFSICLVSNTLEHKWHFQLPSRLLICSLFKWDLSFPFLWSYLAWKLLAHVKQQKRPLP